MLLALMHRVVRIMPLILDCYKRIVKYFDESLVDKCAFLDASRHDRLLIDDESFTRSKKYFWALSTLKELKSSVDANIQEIERLLSLHSPAELHGEQVWLIMVSEGQWDTNDDSGAKRVNRSFDDCRAKLRSVQDELKAISASFRDKFWEVTDLRTGASYNLNELRATSADTVAAIQCQWGDGDSQFYSTGTERYAIDLCQHIILAFLILNGKIMD